MKKLVFIFALLAVLSLELKAQNQDIIGLNYSLGRNPDGDKFTYDGQYLGNYAMGWYTVPGSAEARISGYGGIKLFTNQTNRLSILHNGNVGIGTSSPLKKLDINGAGSAVTMRIKHTNESNSNWGLHLGQKETLDGYLSCHGQNFNIDCGWDKTLSIGNAQFDFYGGKVIIPGGNVGIGTINPGSYKLAVNGKIRAKEIKVETGWADFVFDEDYTLPTLEEVEKHIQEKGHLKDIPSAEEVEENGIFLGEMNAKLLQKIEELTLYIIQQDKRISELESESKKN